MALSRRLPVSLMNPKQMNSILGSNQNEKKRERKRK